MEHRQPKSPIFLLQPRPVRKEPRCRIGEETIHLEEILHLLLGQPAVADELVLDCVDDDLVLAPWKFTTGLRSKLRPVANPQCAPLPLGQAACRVYSGNVYDWVPILGPMRSVYDVQVGPLSDEQIKIDLPIIIEKTFKVAIEPPI